MEGMVAALSPEEKLRLIEHVARSMRPGSTPSSQS